MEDKCRHKGVGPQDSASPTTMLLKDGCRGQAVFSDWRPAALQLESLRQREVHAAFVLPESIPGEASRTFVWHSSTPGEHMPAL